MTIKAADRRRRHTDRETAIAHAREIARVCDQPQDVWEIDLDHYRIEHVRDRDQFQDMYPHGRVIAEVAP